MSYRRTATQYVMNTETFVSVSPDDSDYLAWVALGNTATPFIPRAVTPRQARRALFGVGLLDQVEAIIAQSDRATQIDWFEASEIRRDHPLIASLGGALGLTGAQIDALFINAAGL